MDAFFTPDPIVQRCLTITQTTFPKISSYLEPSAGDGAFLQHLPPDTLAYDIDPKHESIIAADFLQLSPTYVPHRCVIGNPPFSRNGSLYKKFLVHSMAFGDYIAFILPISMFQDQNYFYHWDLIQSVQLGPIIFQHQGRSKKISCCFNLYQKPVKGLNPKPDWTMKQVKIYDVRRDKSFRPSQEGLSVRVCRYGKIGSIAQFPLQFVNENWIYVSPRFETQVIDLIKRTHFQFDPQVRCLPQWRIIKVIKDNIPGID